MVDRLDIIDTKGLELRKYLEKIPWRDYVSYGSVKIQIRDGKPTLITIEETVKID